MTAKDWLKGYADKNLRMDALMEEARLLWDKATGISTVMAHDKVSGGDGETSRLAATVASMVDKYDKLQREAESLMLELARVEAAIEDMPNNRQRELLRLRYLCGWKWERIAQKMQLEVRWVYELHGRALQSIRVPEDVNENRPCGMEVNA